MSNRFTGFDDRDAFARRPQQAAAPPDYPKDAFGIPLAARLARYTFSGPLPANAAQTTPVFPVDFIEFINTEAQLAFPRIVNIWSEAQRAFDARIDWTAGGGKGGRIIASAGGGGIQVCVVAKTIRVTLANWLNVVDPLVTVSIEDGTGDSPQELWRVERGLALASAGAIEFNVPPYAREVMVASDLPAQRPNIVVGLVDNAPALMSAYDANDGPIPVSAASRIRITNNDPAPLASFTLHYRLGYQ